jgi:hypothetical protein
VNSGYIHIFLNCHSVCPLVGIGTPSPSPLSLRKASVYPPPPLNQRAEEHTRQGVREWGSLNADDWRKSLALCLHCGTTHISRGKCANGIASHGDGGKLPCHHYVNYIKISPLSSPFLNYPKLNLVPSLKQPTRFKSDSSQHKGTEKWPRPQAGSDFTCGD